jgi:hypothetical protein
MTATTVSPNQTFPSGTALSLPVLQQKRHVFTNKKMYLDHPDIHIE